MSSKRPKLGFHSSGDHCCAIGCSHKRAKNDCSFFSFPSEKQWFDYWVNALKHCKVVETGTALPGTRWLPQKHHRLCSCHFSNPLNAKSCRLGWNHIIPDHHGSKSAKARKPSRQRLALRSKQCRETRQYATLEVSFAYFPSNISVSNWCRKLSIKSIYA